MARSPINRCRVCGAPIVRMKRVNVWNGYYLDWSRATYCGQKCAQRAYRRRKKAARFNRIFGDV